MAGFASIGRWAGAAAVMTPVPESVRSYHLTANKVRFGSADGPEGVHRVGPMSGNLDFHLGERAGSTEGFEHALTYVLETGDDTGDLGRVRIEADGAFDVAPASLLPPRWDLIIKVDLTVTFYDRPKGRRQAGESGPLVFRSGDPVKFTGTLKSLTPESFKEDGGKGVLERAESGGPEMFGSLPIVGGMMGGGGGGGGLPLPI